MKKNNRTVFFIFLLLLLVYPIIYAQMAFSKAKNDNSFNQAKRQARIIWSDHRQTVYCGCKFDKHLRINLHSCDYHPKDIQRAKRVEWEHIVPVSLFGQNRSCWKKSACSHKNKKKYGGRECCEKKDIQFRQMYTDLHNLVPIIGEVNGARSNFSFTAIPENRKIEIGMFNGCDIIIDATEKTVEPKDQIKGLIARAHLYMAETYAISLKPGQNETMQDWHEKYPPSEWEKEWNLRIYNVTGKNNRFIAEQ